MSAFGTFNGAMSSSLSTLHDGGSSAGLDATRAWNGDARTTQSVSRTKDKKIDGLLSGIKWAGSITYSAPNSLNDYQPGYFAGFDTNDFSAFTSQQMKAFHFALNTLGSASAAFSVSGFTNLTAKFIGGGSGKGTIRGANMDDANNTAYAFYPSTSVYGGDTFFGDFYDGTSNSLKTPRAGNYAWHTMIHEIGHSLGLKHGHESRGSFGPLPASWDSVEFSVMTYRAYIGAATTGYTYEQWGAPQSFMMLDIAALQHMYGADFTTNSTKTVYKWLPGSGNTYVNGKVAIDAGGNRIFATIWDGGGVDTYDLSAYSTAVKIDLRPGKHSVFSDAQLAFLGGGPNGGYARGNIFNALQYKGDKRSLIENATGGKGNDSILGNDANNTLKGMNGNDTLNGGAGKDKLIGGMGKDKLTGGSGADYFIFNAVKESPFAKNGWDVITDFKRADKDRIDLRKIDAKTSTAADDAFKFIGKKAFTGAEGQLRYITKGGKTFVYGDVDGDRKADFAIELRGEIDLLKTDFLL